MNDIPRIGSGDDEEERRDLTDVRPVPERYKSQTCHRAPRVRWRDARGKHSVMLADRSVIGSAPGVDVHVADASASRLHAELIRRPDGLWVRDLGSRNGTWVDDVMIEAARVPDGGRILVGSCELVVEWGIGTIGDMPAERTSFGPLVGGSEVMRKLYARLERVARSDASVLLEGETGTGKELVARAVHEASPRSDKPFIIVDCATLTETLIEAELFGHAKGAFTNAAGTRMGAIEAAEGGTLFLDEIGELPLTLQPKLLRVLEARTVRRLGETHHRPIDVRFISATHRDLRMMVNAGGFREDLYFRLSVLPATVPALRERVEDIPMLIRHFAKRAGRGPVSPDAIAEACRKPWFGNVRELRNFVHRANALGSREALDSLAEAGFPTRDSAPPNSASPPLAANPQLRLDLPLREAREGWLEELEGAYVRGQLERHHGKTTAAARAAGVDRTHFYRLVRKYKE